MFKEINKLRYSPVPSRGLWFTPESAQLSTEWQTLTSQIWKKQLAAANLELRETNLHGAAESGATLTSLRNHRSSLRLQLDALITKRESLKAQYWKS